MSETAPLERPGLWALLEEDLRAHQGDWTRPGFWAVAVHRFGAWRMQRGAVLRSLCALIYWPLYIHVRNHLGIELPWTVKLGRRVIIEHQHGIVIHGFAQIGDDCILRQGVTIGIRSLSQPLAAAVIGKGVNIGAGAKILGAVTIGDGAAIGANAVVLDDVEAGAVVVGIPARPVAKRPGGTDRAGGAA